MEQTKRQIIKTRAGELGHLDCHHLSKDLSWGPGSGTTWSRWWMPVPGAWAEVAADLKSLTVMFATLKSLNLLSAENGVRFAAILTDNGAELASPRRPDTHPVERMQRESRITDRYTRPYRPQTNGKVERFWRTLNDDLLDGTTFESVEELKQELVEYLLYYNALRPYQGLGGKTPLAFQQHLSSN